MKRQVSAQPGLFADKPSRPVVTHVQPLANDPNRRRIKVDGKVVATLRASDVETLGIEVGRAWTESLAERVRRTQVLDKARREALSLLSRRAYSAQSLSERLAGHGHDSSIVKQVIREARRDGWLNERALAEDIARSVTRRQPAGARLIEEKMARQGVNADIARRVVAATAEAQDDRTAAYQLARKRLATMGSIKPQIALRRVAGLLARRGFDQDIVDHALERVRDLLPEIDESDA